MDADESVLAKKKHVEFFKMYLYFIPARMFVLDSTRLSIVFFSISGLEILGALSDYNESTKKSMCDWIYSLQIHPDEDGDCSKCGFQGTDTFMTLEDGVAVHCNKMFANGHLAMTYTGLVTLVTLGDDLSRVNRPAIIKGVAALQQEDGSFACTLLGSENDMRFVYCACCICYILQDWSGMDMDKTLSYIRGSFSYDYGFGQGPDLESHGGVAYCAVASLVLMGKLHDVLTPKEYEGLRRWALMKQVAGFQGRANKQEDTCYSFWVGATLKMLDFYEMVNYEENRKYVMSTQCLDTGGFSKVRFSYPDPLHSYLGLCGLSFMGENGLGEVHPALNMSMRAVNCLHKIHQSW
ncbi:Protein geranylgeranyltransferase type I, beta subunit [Nesidiocoris tenuis]|uniref:Geranylgeranyl transferase type-1 subunit beta n=1 Tax=Nesidiocoris tenuis TaxID=355587 RepID=A0ABN7A971_9HEMI|nr:Protein geranylgeranyltransferase type I, beta subunit [Nesidiocoris tenuis]